MAWDVATKVLSLGLCKDGQSNVLNCSTDSKSKSGCDVQTLRTRNGFTSGVQVDAMSTNLPPAASKVP